MNNTMRTIIMWLVIPMVVIFGIFFVQSQSGPTEEVKFSDVMRFGEQGMIESLKVSADRIEGRFKEEQKFPSSRSKVKGFKASIIFYDGLIPEIRNWDIDAVTLENSTTGDFVLQMFAWIVPLGIFAIFWLFFVRQMQAGGNKAMMFGKSKAKLLSSNQKNNLCRRRRM